MSYNFENFLEECRSQANSMNHRIVTIDHVALKVLEFPSIVKMLSSMGLDSTKIVERITSVMGQVELPELDAVVFTANNDEATKDTQNSVYVAQLSAQLQKRAVLDQLRTGDISVEPYVILFECLSFPETVLASVLAENGLTLTKMATNIQVYLSRDSHEDEPQKESTGDAQDEPQEGVRRGNSSGRQRNKMSLTDFTVNLNERAKSGLLSPLIGRESELHSMMQILSRKTKQNPVLVGEPGTGKTQIVDGLVRAIVEGNVPESIKNLTVLSLDMGAVMAGTKFRGEFEERIHFILKEMRAKPDTVLFIDELHNIIGTGSSTGTMDMSNMLKPALSNGELRVIGATTLDEFRKHIEKDGALSRRFMKVDVEEPTLQETRQIVKGVQSVYEAYHNVKFSKDAVEAIVMLSNKYINNKRFPDKAIDLLDSTGAQNRVQAEPLQTITVAEVQREVARIAKLPLEVVACEESDRVLNLSDNLRKRVYGQDKAIEALVDNVMIARAGLREHTSIQGAFLFVGPSGTGKTEITKALADTMGSELIRFDMSEFTASHTIAKMIGSPPGYVGHDSGNGVLLDKIEQYPNAILLLDEIEKAHPQVLLTFLQVMDEGHLTGSQGKTVSFKNVTLIMTTNMGAAQSEARSIGLGDGDDGIDSAVKEALKPEFINRIDAIVKFKELDSKAVNNIIDKFIAGVNDSVKDRKVKVTLTKEAKAWLASKGVQKGMGARPMKRCINENIKKVLAREIMVGSLKTGGKAKFDVLDGKIVLVQEQKED